MNTSSRSLHLTEQLLSCPSVTPDDAGCLEIIGQRLAPLGFELHRLDSGPDNFRVSNLWAVRAGTTATAQTMVFAGHTDVVPTGPIDQWISPPFVPSHRNESGVDNLFGRGSSDMKSSIACFIVAIEELLTAQPNYPHRIALLLTSDEEGPAMDGTVKVCEWLSERDEKLDWCIVGEPTSVERTGDMIKNGRRGTMSGKLTVKGIQGHIAYPQLARNPIHQLAPALAELVAIEWDKGNEYFQPTSWQVSNIHGGTGASNVIPGEVVVDFNFRFCTESTPESLQQRLQAVLDQHGLEYTLSWTVGGLPFLTPVGSLVQAAQDAIRAETGIETELSTTGGTSDGRFIAKICPQVIELGPPNATIHKVNEHIALHDMEPLKNIYRRLLENLAR
jgi:succinyl-diaminopimelate desuccinylase